VRARGRANTWIDLLLLGGVLLAVLGACSILALMAWQAPEAIRAAYAPTTPAWTATQQPTSAPSQTATPTQTLSPSLTPTPTATPQPTTTATPAPTPALPGTPNLGVQGKWIDIDVSEQTLTAYQGKVPVLSVAVSTGTAHTPTPLGEFAIYARVPIQDMGGPGYLLRDVQYVAYFERDYALHATYWHDNFGQPMSHGCVNMRTADARWLYDWAPVGTPVRVHD
jgi:lipoprotein-anchoring transpeptidase ErfK/SrfK